MAEQRATIDKVRKMVSGCKTWPNVRVMISGSREWSDAKSIIDHLSTLPKEAIVLHGGARGADTIAEHACQTLKIETRVFHPDWQKYGRRAGLVRNAEMVQEADCLIAFPMDPSGITSSRGTMHAVKSAHDHKIQVVVVTRNSPH